MLSIYNGDKKNPIRANYDVNDAPATVKGLVQKLVDDFKYNEKVALKWSNLLSDQLVKMEEEFWKQIYDIDISPDEIPLLKVKMVNSEATFTYPPSFLLVCLRCSEAALSE
jgi:hypothetical protein